MKKTILKYSTSLLLLGSLNLNAGQIGQLSLFEVSPDSYGKQVFSIGFDTYATKNENNFENKNSLNEDQDYFDNLNIVLSNKATLKKFGYEKGEIYWRGTGNFGFDFNNDAVIAGAEIGFGMLNNFNYFYTGLDISGEYQSFNYTSDNADDTTETDTASQTGLTGSFTIGKRITNKLDIGLLAGYEIGKIDIGNYNDNYSKTIFSGMFSYKQYREITVNVKGTYSELKSDNVTDYYFDIKEFRAMVSFSWRYNL